MNQQPQNKLEPLNRTLIISAAIPLLLLALLTVVFRFTNLDLEIARCFFDDETKTWPWRDSTICRIIYHGLPVPGILLGIFAATVALSKTVARKTGVPRLAGLFIFLVLMIGPGLIVNGGFKPLWSRARPVDVAEFNGREAFAPVWTSSYPSTSRSFPSGHASMGFIWIAPAFLLIRRRPWQAIGFFALGVGIGGLLGLVRVAEGGHFTSDILWAAGFVYITCLVVTLATRGTQARRSKSDELKSRLLEASRDRWYRMLDTEARATVDIKFEETETNEQDRRAA